MALTIGEEPANNFIALLSDYIEASVPCQSSDTNWATIRIARKAGVIHQRPYLEEHAHGTARASDSQTLDLTMPRWRFSHRFPNRSGTWAY